MTKIFLISLLILIASSCGIATVRPKLEMQLAAAAFLAAKEANADELASPNFRKAESYYLRARSAYRRKYFNKAKEYAILSKRFSELAEYTAIRKHALGQDKQ